MPLLDQKKRVLRIFSKYSANFLLVYIFVFYNLLAQQFDTEASNQTQDWIFGDGPEPKWVIELLHGAYQNIKEDNKYILKVPITGSGIKYSASVDGNAVIERDGDYLIISPDKNYNGTILVNLNLDMSFILNVQSVNDLPIISKVKKQNINEDEIFRLKLNAEDAESDQLTYGATVDGNAVVKVVNDNLTITPNNNYFGPINVNLAVSDGKATDETNFILDVKPINDAPILKSIVSSSQSKNNRVDLMVNTGLEVEAKTLSSMKNLKPLNTVGYREWFNDHNQNNKKFVVEEIKKNSRRYAKRQITWFKKYKSAKWIEPKKSINYIIQNHK